MDVWNPRVDDEDFTDENECENFHEHWYDQMVD